MARDEESNGLIVLWEGSPSQWALCNTYIRAAAGFLMFMSLAAVIYVWSPDAMVAWFSELLMICVLGACICGCWGVWEGLVLSMTSYRVDEERVTVRKGIFTREKEVIELFRVKDQSVSTPWYLGLMGLGHLHLKTSDETLAQMPFMAIKDPDGVEELIRVQALAMREKYRVSEVDFGSQTPN